MNSHFGILDICGFLKDRAHWYKAWFLRPAPTPALHVFPHWNWAAGDAVDVWAYSNADSVELFVNGVSQGVKAMGRYGHVEWDKVAFAPGSITAVGYMNGSTTGVVEVSRNTTGAPAALLISVKDGVGSALVAGCADVALVQVQVVDAQGLEVPYANNVVTFSVTGAGAYIGGGNGDPAEHTPDKSPSRPAFHGLLLGVFQAGDEVGILTVQATADGLPPVTLTLPVSAPPAGVSAPWCHTEPRL